MVTPTANNDEQPTRDLKNRLRRQSRLLDAAAFGRVFKQAERSRDNLFTVLYTDNDERAPRLGLAISKKNCRLAVERNRLKRIVRESFRQHQATLPGIDIVVLNQAGTHKANNKQLFASLGRHWQRCGRAGSAAREKA